MTIEDIVNEVMVDVPGAPLATIRQEIYRAARKFCEDADVWIERDVMVTINIGMGTAEIAEPSEGEPVRLISLDGVAKSKVPNRGWTQVSPRQISFDQAPPVGPVYGVMSVKPFQGTLPPEEVTNHWHEAFANGARARLMLMPQEWRDPELSQLYQARYQADVNSAKQASRLGYGTGTNRVRPWRFI